MKTITHTIVSKECTVASLTGIAPDLVENFVWADNQTAARNAAIPVFERLWNAGCITHQVEIVDGKRQHSFTVAAKKIRED